jgi:RNA polymerase sigma-70 factor (ECF subfamily)
MQAGDRVERERELRRAVLAGEEFAWRTLYDESFAVLYAYVLWRCGGLRDRTDEVVQETWLTAVRRLRAFDEEAQEQAECIAAALAALPEYYKAVLRMKYLEGRSVADIAAERGESLKTIESQLTRAREAFRQAFLQSE